MVLTVKGRSKVNVGKVVVEHLSFPNVLPQDLLGGG